MEDAQLLQAQLGVELASKEQRRAALSAQAQAAAAQNAASVLQSMAAYQASVLPKSPPVIRCTTTQAGVFTNTNCF